MKPVLVLNADYRPLELPFGTTSPEQAINRLVAGSYHVVHFYDNPIQSQNQERVVKVLGFSHWPSIVALNEFVPRQESVGFNMANLLRRDEGKCRYCGDDLTNRTGTVDHYIPTSKGGKNCWTNAVLCCTTCNSRKSDAVPTKENGWLLEVPPHEPKAGELQRKSRLFPITVYDKEWLNYLPKWQGKVTIK